MNWWLRTYHQDGSSATVEGPGTEEAMRDLDRENDGLVCEYIQWEPGQPIPPALERKCGKG